MTYLSSEEYLETIKDQLGDIIELQKEIIHIMKGKDETNETPKFNNIFNGE